MTDNKQKIGIIDMKKQCDECRASAEEFDGFYPDCKDCPIFTATITRAEAVERMAKALHSFVTIPTTEEQWQNEVIDNVKSLYRNKAEAALGALLGAGNGK